MGISRTTLKGLIALTKGEKVASSSLSGEIPALLISEGILLVEVHGRRKRYYVKSGQELRTFLSCNFRELQDMETYLDLLENREELSRALLTEVTGDSKTIKHRTCKGFLVNCYAPIKSVLCGKDVVIAPAEGSCLFISDPESFSIPNGTTIVGIENMENFTQIRSQRQLFDRYAGDGNILFVSRYPQNESRDLQMWLSNIPNRYIHFGDFDPAGIRIYQTEFLSYMSLERCSFLVPDDIENRIVNGSSERYNSQISIMDNLQLSDMRLNNLLSLFKKYHKCCDQEVYID